MARDRFARARGDRTEWPGHASSYGACNRTPRGAPLKIEASEKAIEYIVEHGGKLYIWADESDLGHASPRPPADPIDWIEYPEEGFTLYQDASIGEPDWWRVEFHRLPLPHLTAIWDGGRFGAVGPPPPEED